MSYRKLIWVGVVVASWLVTGCSTDTPRNNTETNPDEPVALEDAGSMTLNDETKPVVAESESANEDLTRGDPVAYRVVQPEPLASKEPVADDNGAEPVSANTALGTSSTADPTSENPEIAEITVLEEANAGAVGNNGGRTIDDVDTAESSSAAAASNDSKPIAHYFPLDDGRRWNYRVKITRGNEDPQAATATKHVKGDKDIARKKYVRVATKCLTVAGKRSISVPDQHYRLDEQGVYAAVEGLPGKELLILPAEPRVTRSWSGTADPKFTEFAGVAAVNETYRCDGQVFEGCVKITLEMNLVVGGLFGRREVPVRFDRWFAPGVGMVAEVREVGPKGNPNERWVSELAREES